MHFHFLMWILTRKYHYLHVTIFCTCFEGFFLAFFQLLNPGGRQWGQLQLPVHLRQEKQRLLLLRRHGGRQRDLWARESFSVSFFFDWQWSLQPFRCLYHAPHVCSWRNLSILSPDRISTRIWNKKIVSFWRHYSSISSTLPWVPTSRSIVHLVHHSQSLLLRLLSHVLTILSYSAFIIGLPITYWICIKRVSAVIIILTKVIRIKERANSVNNCQQRERWRTGWNEPKDDRLPSWKDDRSQRAGHRPCISMAW